MADEPYIIETQPVVSSNIHAIGYDVDRRVLAVEFMNGGIFHYGNITPEKWADFQAAESKGKFFGTQIRGKHVAQKMTGECPRCGGTGRLGLGCDSCGCDTYQPKARPAEEASTR